MVIAVKIVSNCARPSGAFQIELCRINDGFTVRRRHCVERHYRGTPEGYFHDGDMAGTLYDPF